VGSLENLCKASDVLIDAAGICVSAGLDIELKIVGTGRYQPWLEGRSARLGLTGHVEFVGCVPGPQAVRAYLDEADLFVLPSRADATPRALLEAMARGLPAIGSTVGAMPELLSPCDLVPPNDPVALANKIREVILNPDLRRSMAARNLSSARQYRLELVRRPRAEFLSRLQDETKRWMCRQRHN
jgi:glycosyltransferase involved in cell wall biosynthesis